VDPQEERLVGVVDKLGRGVLDVEHPRGVEEGTIVALAPELGAETAERRRGELDPRLDRRVGREVPTVPARSHARDERLELVEPLRIPQ